MSKFSRLLQKQKTTTECWNPTTVEQQHIWGKIQNFIRKHLLSFEMYLNIQEHPYFCKFYYKNDLEQNRTFTQICWSLQEMNQH